MHDVTEGGRGDRGLLWIAATSFFTPDVPAGWRLIDLAGEPEAILGSIAPPDGYSVVFEATFNSRLQYDPVIRARAVWEHFQRAPDALVGVVAPSLEVPVATQHAIAHETGLVLGGSRVGVVTITEQWSPQSDSKMRKSESTSDRRYPTGLDKALEIAAGKGRGGQVDQTAAAFVYAYTSRKARRTPFRCTPLQRRILQVVASGAIVPTTFAIAGAVYAAEKKVSESIAELVDALAPRAAGEPESRDGHQRLYWLVHRYGAWIRMVDGREMGGSNP